MKAWRFYGFGDMRLDDVPVPPIRPGHVLAEILCVQPSVTEAQLAFGIPTLAFEKIKQRLESEAPVQLFGHEYCARIVEIGEGVTRFSPAIAWLPARNFRAANARCVPMAGRISAAKDPSSDFSYPGVSRNMLFCPKSR